MLAEPTMMAPASLSFFTAAESTGAMNPLSIVEAALDYIPLTRMLSFIAIGIPSIFDFASSKISSFFKLTPFDTLLGLLRFCLHFLEVSNVYKSIEVSLGDYIFVCRLNQFRRSENVSFHQPHCLLNGLSA